MTEDPPEDTVELPVLGRIGAARSRRWAAGLSALIAIAAFFPFRPGYGGPIRLANGVSVEAPGSLVFSAPSVCRTAGPTDWAAEAIASEELDLYFEFRSADPAQAGPARLVTLSSGAYARNFMVAQKGVDLLVRVRRATSDENGAPPLKVDGVFAESGEGAAVRSLLVRFRRDVIEILLDGHAVYSEKQEASPFATWDPSYRFAVGNEINGTRAWTGEIRGLSLSVSDQVFDPLVRGDLEMPGSSWHVPERARRLVRFDPSHAALTAAIHMAVFVPLGGLMWLGRRRRGPGWAEVLKVAFAAALFGALVQVGKLAFEARHPSLFHALPNGLGAAAGALLVHGTTRRTNRG